MRYFLSNDMPFVCCEKVCQTNRDANEKGGAKEEEEYNKKEQRNMFIMHNNKNMQNRREAFFLVFSLQCLDSLQK